MVSRKQKPHIRFLRESGAVCAEVVSISRIILIFTMCMLIVPSIAIGDLRSFIPTIYSYEGELAADAFYMSEKKTGEGFTETDKRHTLFSQRFVLTTKGWIYHPRFILFLVGVGVGMNEDDVRGGFDASDDGLTTNPVYDYEFRALILPEHPYNLELFTLRRNPYVTGKFTRGVETLGYNSGAIFKYKHRPYRFILSYNTSTLESTRYTTDTNTLNANASYFKDWGNFSGSYSHKTSESSYAVFHANSTTDSYSLGNQLQLIKKKAYLSSNVNKIIFEQEDFIRSYGDDRFTWTEHLNVELPWHFSANLFYNHFKDDGHSTERATGIRTTLSSKSDSAAFSVQQKLYQSLLTTYSFSYMKNTSSTGDSKGTTHSLSSEYTKKIPWGILKAGINLSRSVIDRTGAETTLNMTPPLTPITGEFLLPQEVDASSIILRVRDDDTGTFIDMIENIHYLVQPEVGNNIPIRIIGIPVEALNADPFYKYTFQVTFSLVPVDAKIQTDAYGYALKVHLFNYLLTPYYSYDKLEQKVLSGTLFGEPENSTSNVVGLLIQKDPFTLDVRYQDYQATTNPYKQYKIELKYRKAVTETTQVNGRAYYTRTRYERTSSLSGTNATEDFFGGDINVMKRFPKKNLTANLGAFYYQTTGRSETRSYLIDASLVKSMGKLDIRAGAKIGSSTQELGRKQESLNQYYYLSLRRKLF